MHKRKTFRSHVLNASSSDNFPKGSHQTDASLLAQPGAVGGAPHPDSAVGNAFSKQDATRRAATGNALPMSQLQAGGPAAGNVVGDNAGSVKEFDSGEAERYNAVQRGGGGGKGL